MRQAFPEMRILGRHPYYLRQTLLWAPETQVVSVTAESARRTEMIQRQLEREQHPSTMSRDEFLQMAAPVVMLRVVADTDDSRFPRAAELVNKTNQFNKTGRRRTFEDFGQFLENGGRRSYRPGPSNRALGDVVSRAWPRC